jgi:hypothetical protein
MPYFKLKKKCDETDQTQELIVRDVTFVAMQRYWDLCVAMKITKTERERIAKK